MTAAPEALEPTLSAEAAEQKAHLQKHFGRKDILFFLVCTLVGIDGLGTLATQGGAGFTWLIACVVLFAVPSAVVLSELGAAYTDEGGPYIWVRAAFGHLTASINNFFYWVTNPVWMGGTLVAVGITGITVFFNDGAGIGRVATYSFGMVFIWGGVLFAILSFQVGKWVATVGAFARFALLGLFSVVVLLYGVQHGFKGIGAGGFMPTYASFVLLVPLILFSLVGFELPSAAGEEMEDAAEDVPSGIAKSVLMTALLYGIPVLGILLVLPTSELSGLDGFPDALKQSLTVLGGTVTPGAKGAVTVSLSGAGLVVGWVMGILVAVIAFTSGLTWIMGSDRTLAVSSYDGAGPRSLGAFSPRFGTPVRVNILSGVVSTVIFVATELVTGGDVYKFFSVALNLAISTTLISYLGIFPAALVLRRRRPNDHRPFKTSTPVLWVCTVLSMAAILFATVQVLFPGVGDAWFGADYRPESWKGSEKLLYLGTEAVPLAIFTAIAVLFWWMGRAHRSDPNALTSTPPPEKPAATPVG